MDLRSGHPVLQEPPPPKSRKKRRAPIDTSSVQTTGQDSFGSSGVESSVAQELQTFEEPNLQSSSSDLIDLTSATPSSPNSTTVKTTVKLSPTTSTPSKMSDDELKPCPPKLSPFTGMNDKVLIDRWIAIFDFTIADKFKTDIERIKGLSSYLKDEALNWFADSIIPDATQLTWSDVKTRIIQRFGMSELHPLITAQRRKLMPKESVKDYFEDKMRYLRRAKLDEEAMAASLTEGMPYSYKVGLHAAQLKTTNNWIAVALSLEKDQEWNRSRPHQSSHSKPTVHFHTDDQIPSNSEQPRPLNYQKHRRNRDYVPRCQICKRQGRKEFHWHRDCPLNKSHDSTLSPSDSHPQSNVIVKTTNHAQTISPSDFITIRVKIGQVKTKAVLDTGANIHVISSKFVRQLNLRIDTRLTTRIKLASGHVISQGMVRFPIAIGPYTRHISAHVLGSLSYDLMLGVTIGNLFPISTNLPKRQAYIEDPHTRQPICLGMELSSSCQLQSLMTRHSGLFATNSTDVGKIEIEKHRIRTTDHPPISQRPYDQSIANERETDRQVADLLVKGLIRESTSPWASPVTLVDKKDGTKRLCIDYRKLNSITIDDKQPLPKIQYAINKLRGSKFFTTLDVAAGYWHVSIDPRDIDKTAFVTHNGHYEWLVMPFGLKTAVATFQRLIQKSLGDLLNNGCLNYLDDIIVYSETLEDHITLLSKVFDRLTQHHIKLNRGKCKFIQQEVEYLGHLIGHNTVKITPSKVKSVSDYPRPTTLKQVRRFTGLTGVYRRFIPNYTEIAEPLSRLTRKNVPFSWTEEQQQSFEKLKNLLVSGPVLQIFDPDKVSTLYTDASKVGIGAVLSQEGHPVAYYSRRLNIHEENYTTSELECLAVVNAIEHFHVYLHGTHFNIITDHSALKWLFSIKKPTGKLYRWSVRLSVYNYTILHKPGSQQKHVDALSRAPVSMHLTTTQIVDAQSKADMPLVKSQFKSDGIISVRKGGIVKTVVPQSLVPELLQKYHENSGHPGRNKMVKTISAKYWWSSLSKDIASHVRSCHECQLVKASSKPRLGQLQPIETPTEPLELIAIDTIVMGNSAEQSKAKYIQVVIDHLTRYVWAFATSKNTAETIINVLSQLFKTVGYPKRILTDRATSFTSKSLKRFLASCPNPVRHSLTASYHPQTNGMNEKANGTITEKLRIAQLENPKRKWSSLLPNVVDQYNNTVHDSTGFTPKFLFWGKDGSNTITTPLSEARQMAHDRTEQMRLKWKQEYDSRHRPYTFKPDDLVKHRIPKNRPDRNKLTPNYEGPYKIIRMIVPNAYEVLRPDSGTTSAFNIEQLEPYFNRGT